jgi:hypothetical protein
MNSVGIIIETGNELSGAGFGRKHETPTADNHARE